jgi:PcrA/UvrD tudor domain
MALADDEAVPCSRDELITMVARAHGNAPYAESAHAGRTLAASSKLPKKIAENLGAGFGQWDFFPSAVEIIDFALGYVPPAAPEDAWALARAWAADEAGGRSTPLALVGREILQHELRRFDLPDLRAAVDEVGPARARELRVAIGLEVGPEKETKTATTAKLSSPRPKRSASTSTAPPREIPTRMPKPEFKRPPPPPPAAAAKRFSHPKFGEGVLVSQDGAGEDAKLTIKFAAATKTLLARFVTELP